MSVDEGKIERDSLCQEGDENINKEHNGNIYFCDSQLRMWTRTASVFINLSHNYAWGPSIDESDDSCVGKGADYPACHYCDTLDYLGYTDWVLPSCFSGKKDSGCLLYQFVVDACNGSFPCRPSWDINAERDIYLSSSEYNYRRAWYINFNDGYLQGVIKSSYKYIRCVRE